MAAVVSLLAAAMQFSGFRSVLGTMCGPWRMTDWPNPLTRTLSIAPMLAVAGSERVDDEPSASALRDTRRNSQKTRGLTLGC